MQFYLKKKRRLLLLLLLLLLRSNFCENFGLNFIQFCAEVITGCVQWRIQGRGTGGPPPSLFLDQNEARWAEKNFFEATPPTPLSQGVDDRGPPYLRVWIRHWCLPINSMLL